MIPINAPSSMRLLDLARLADATGNLLIVENWRLAFRPIPNRHSNVHWLKCPNRRGQRRKGHQPQPPEPTA